MRYLALKIGMKYQSYYPYPLQVDFESPLWDFIKKDGNEKIVGDLMVKRMQNGLRYKRMNNGKMESFISETLMAIRYGLPQEVENIHKEIDDQDFQKDEQEKVFNEAKTILCNPAAIRDFGDTELKQLVIRVCFNNKIMYKKIKGCTPLKYQVSI